MKDSTTELNKIVIAPDAAKETQILMDGFAADRPVFEKIRSLGLTKAQVKANLGFIADYQCDVDYCAHCPGLSSCHKDSPFHQSDLLLVDGRLERTFGPCKLYMQEQTVIASYLYRDFPDEWVSLRPENLSRSNRVRKITGAFTDAKKSPTKPWVYITGSVGSGRSYLTAAFANGFVINGGKAAFMNANKRFDELKGLAVKDKKTFESRLTELESLPLLVIDDFGSEFKSDYVRDQIVLPLLTERAKRNLQTVLISDYSLAEIKELYSASRSSAIMAGKLIALIESKIAGVTPVEPGLENQR
jgi:DNA replication protein